MFDTLLVNDDALMLRVDADLWDCMYPQLAGSYSFRLRPNTEMVFHLPFVVEAVYSERYPMERVQKEKMSLVISQYPVKKVIELKIKHGKNFSALQKSYGKQPPFTLILQIQRIQSQYGCTAFVPVRFLVSFTLRCNHCCIYTQKRKILKK